MATFMEIKSTNPKLKQYERADQLSYSSSTLQRKRNDITMLSPERIQSNITDERSKTVSNTNLDNNSYREHDLKRPQMTSNDLAEPDTITESIVKRLSNKRNKRNIKGGSIHESIEINDEFLDDIIHNNNL